MNRDMSRVLLRRVVPVEQHATTLSVIHQRQRGDRQIARCSESTNVSQRSIQQPFNSALNRLDSPAVTNAGIDIKFNQNALVLLIVAHTYCERHLLMAVWHSA